MNVFDQVGDCFEVAGDLLRRLMADEVLEAVRANLLERPTLVMDDVRVVPATLVAAVIAVIGGRLTERGQVNLFREGREATDQRAVLVVLKRSDELPAVELRGLALDGDLLTRLVGVEAGLLV